MFAPRSVLRFIGGSGPPRSICGRFRSGSHRRCPSATQHVVPPAAEPPQGNAGDERVAEVGQPPLPASTGGTLCFKQWSPTNLTSKALLIKDKPTTKYHQSKETRNRELIDERALIAFEVGCEEAKGAGQSGGEQLEQHAGCEAVGSHTAAPGVSSR